MPDTDAQAAATVFTDLARLCTEGRVSERWIADAVNAVISRSRYAHEVMDQPLGRLLGFDDEWEGGWGRPENELKRDTVEACAKQIAAYPDECGR